MGRKGTFLKSLCHHTYGKGDFSKPTQQLITESGRYEEVNRIYKELGGILDIPPFHVDSWDIETKDFIIELDEENHFNRYRLITLNSLMYQEYDNFRVELYKKYCVAYEKKCPKTQKRWSTPSADKQFGISPPNGEFSGNGPSRWKQRAFYDYLRDTYSIITGIPVIRLSIYDQVGYKTLLQLLEDQDTAKIKAHINELIRKNY